MGRLLRSGQEIRHLNTVLDLFEKHFRKPDRVIQYGCSGGGAVGLAVAEDFSNRVDGVIATGAHVPVWLMNTMLDGWFVLNTLIAPDLEIVDLPDEPSLRPQHVPIAFAWRQAIDAAQQTPEGRARIALAFAIGQWPDWTDPLIPNPDRDDLASLQRNMYLTLVQRYAAPGDIGGRSRYMFENPAGLRSAQLSWNTGVDYGSSSKTATRLKSGWFVSSTGKPGSSSRPISKGSRSPRASRRIPRPSNTGVRPDAPWRKDRKFHSRS